jgi:transposase InsO family protein
VRRSVEQQMERRRLERALRVDVLALCRWCSRRGLTLERAADLVGVSVDTVRTWQRRWREDRLVVEARGRPLERAETAMRNFVLAVIGLCGPGVSVATLSELFPVVARRELEDIARRYRSVWRKRGVLMHVLHWRRTAAVWAMDYTEPPALIDESYRAILVVRDLASGKQLCALPVREASARVTCDALRSLFVEHGPPYVLKSDNGSHFTADEVAALLRQHQVLHLRSPTCTPKYNGACEAGIGGLKTRAHHEAARQGRPGHWTCDDVEAARLIANECARPRGPCAPTPDEVWRERIPLSAHERELLRCAVERSTTEERDRMHPDASTEPSPHMATSIERIAICRAVLELGILQLRRRRFTLPIRTRKAINIS